MNPNPEPAMDHEEAVLQAFSSACPRPTAADIIEWTRRHPAHADAIREVAEIALQFAQVEEAGLAPEAPAVPAAEPATFAGLLARAGRTVPQVARELGLGRAVVTDLVQGRMALPLPRRFALALAGTLAAGLEAVEAAARDAAAHPRMGHARAESAPAARPRSFAEIVAADASMSADQKARWLAAE